MKTRFYGGQMKKTGIMNILTMLFFILIGSGIPAANVANLFTVDAFAEDTVSQELEAPELAVLDLEDGTYTVEVTLQGGSGRASVASPATLVVEQGTAQVQICWSSSNYDYMKLGETKYLPINDGGNSVFELPVTAFDTPVPVIADTTAMSTPHEVEYTLTFQKDSIASVQVVEGEQSADDAAQEATQKNEAAAGDAAQEEVAQKDETTAGDAVQETMQENNQSAGETSEDADAGSQPAGILADRDLQISAQLTYDHSMSLSWAQEFAVDYYTGDYVLISISNGDRYLVLPEGSEAPEDLAEGITILKQPVSHIYLVASAVMDMLVAQNALDTVAFSALTANSWYIPEARTAMEAGEIQYAGKYSAPDYEQIIAGTCDLAIENTMIYHTPEVKEQLEKFGIPVFVDYSSYETHPLGRMEWVKLYGLLTGHEAEAEAAFTSEAQLFESIQEEVPDGPTVAFFYITSNGEINVRRSSDYLPKMIELAGGSYIFDDLGTDDSHSSTMTMQLEEFYARAKDADYIIYNSTIDGEITSVEELLGKSQLLQNFKAVKENHVYCTTKNLYQSTMELGTMISDLHGMLTDTNETLTFLYKLE